MILVELDVPRKKRVTLPFGFRTILVMTAGGAGSGMLNTVPAAPGPPLNVVPYSEFPKRINGATGNAPWAFVPLLSSAPKQWSVVNCAPLRFSENTAPAAPTPPAEAVP